MPRPRSPRSSVVFASRRRSDGEDGVLLVGVGLWTAAAAVVVCPGGFPVGPDTGSQGDAPISPTSANPPPTTTIRAITGIRSRTVRDLAGDGRTLTADSILKSGEYDVGPIELLVREVEDSPCLRDGRSLIAATLLCHACMLDPVDLNTLVAVNRSMTSA